MLKNLTPQEQKTNRQIEIFLVNSRTNRIANTYAAKDWQRFRKEQHARAVDAHVASGVAAKASK